MFVWEFYDKLDDMGCWAGLDGRAACMDSYATVPNYDRIIEVLREEANVYTPDQWQEIYEDCRFHAYQSPNAGILAGLIKRCVIEPQVEKAQPTEITSSNGG